MDDTILLDGGLLVDEALEAGLRVELIVCLPGSDRELLDRVQASGGAVYETTAAVMDAASPVRQPSGLVGLGTWPAAPLADVIAGAKGPLLGLVDVQDPGNLGSAIRAADALGGGGVLALDACADPGGWKALRGAMGSTFRVPVARGPSADALAAASARGMTIVATNPAAGVSLDDVEWPDASLVLLGNEGAGLPADLLGRADLLVRVPMRPGIDSLNVAVAAALILDAARRGRAARSPR
jgi:TrmH family RNA methyltransferase